MGRACKWNILFYWHVLQGTVAQRSISAYKPEFSFFQKHFFGYFSLLFLRASKHQLVDKMNSFEFTVLKAFTSEFKLRTNPVKAVNGRCVWLTSITFPVIWSSVLISVSREWCYHGLVYKFFLKTLVYGWDA